MWWLILSEAWKRDLRASLSKDTPHFDSKSYTVNDIGNILLPIFNLATITTDTHI